MIISDINYVEVVSEVEIEGGSNDASFGSLIAKDITASLTQSATSSAYAYGGLNNVAIIGSGVGSINAPTYATSNASNSGSINISA
jgi:hypothetical protein